MKPRVAILTSLADYSPAYSLVGIILDQARMLKRYGYDYDLLCIKNFNHKEHGAEVVDSELSVRYILPQTRLVDYQPHQPAEEPRANPDGSLKALGFEQQAEIHFEGDPEKGTIGYRDALKDYDVIISHDIMFLTWHLVQNAALRRCIDLYPEKTWLHWAHSGPSVPPASLCYPSTLRYEKAPNSTHVYLNYSQRHDYALMIKATDREVAVVYNPKDIRDVYEFDSLTCDIIDRYSLLDHEVLQVYPFSTPRWRDKGIKQLFRIFGAWKSWGAKAKLVLVNAHCNSPKDQPELEAIKGYASLCKLELGEDVILTSDFADEVEPDLEYRHRKLRYTVPSRTVQQLMFASNMFIFPTMGECCSLIQAEASIAGKHIVLNRDFRPLLEFCCDEVSTFEFTHNNPDQNLAYYECVAREILSNFRNDVSLVNRTRAITKTYNRDWIFKNQLEPLLYKGASDRLSGKTAEVIRPELRRPVIEAHEVEDKADEPKAQFKRDGVNWVRDEGSEVAQIKESKVGNPDEPDYHNPWPGMECPIFDACSEGQKQQCFTEAGRCLVLDGQEHQAKIEAAAKKK